MGGTPDPPIEHDTDHGEGELERTIGLVGGLAIGIGTMIGAGIFVFPGLAAVNAGPAAALSFAIGAVVALPASDETIDGQVVGLREWKTATRSSRRSIHTLSAPGRPATRCRPA